MQKSAILRATLGSGGHTTQCGKSSLFTRVCIPVFWGSTTDEVFCQFNNVLTHYGRGVVKVKYMYAAEDVNGE
jgi:hypothetical protein